MVPREEQIQQSVQDFVREGLEAHDYVEGQHFNMRDAFPTPDERASELTTSQIAVGFNFDDGGRHIELGSDLTMRVYTIEFWVFGTSERRSRHLANVIRTILEDNNYLVPLKDIEQAAQPVIDQLVVPEERGISVQRQIASDPRPWDRYVFTTTVRLEDTYYPSLVN